MGKTSKELSVLCISVALILMVMVSHSRGESTEGKWSLGLRGGAAYLPQDVDDGTEGKIGPIIGSRIMYGLTDILSLGLNLEWEKHEIKDEPTGLSFGDQTTLSLLFVSEWRSPHATTFSPYFSLGMGLNQNMFSESGELQDFTRSVCLDLGLSPQLAGACRTELEPERTFAGIFGLGADYFITSHLTFNSELGYKLNYGNIKLKASLLGFSQTEIAKDDVSVLSLVVGLRYFF
jgi:hypothetical protein